MNKLLKSLKTISSILYIALLIISYSYLIESNPVFLNLDKSRAMHVEMFFYLGLGIFVFISLIFFIFDKVLLSYQGKYKESNFFTSNSFLSWLVVFNISINILLCTGILFISFLNSESYYNLLHYSFLLYIGPILIFLTILWLPVLYFKKS